MARYIDADKLHYVKMLVQNPKTGVHKHMIAVRAKEINKASTVDVQPVIHAKWETGYTFPDGAYWKCTHCKTLIKVKLPMDYCNACGAKMVEPQESEVNK